MAKMSVSGDDFVEKFATVQKNFEKEATESILKAGADVYSREWRGSISSHGHVRTGAMLGSVGMSDIKHDLGSASVEIYPQGTDSRGVRNALKAYVINAKDKFVKQAEASAKPQANDAMQRALDDFINTKGLT